MAKPEPPSSADIERGLTDNEWRVRWKWAQRLDFTPTPDQISRGLEDWDTAVRQRWSARLDFIPTPAQIERALTDPDPYVRWNLSHRVDFIPTPAQIERGFLDDDLQVRLAWATRTDLYLPLKVIDRLNSALLERGLNPLQPTLHSHLRAQAEASELNSLVATNHVATTDLTGGRLAL